MTRHRRRGIPLGCLLVVLVLALPTPVAHAQNGQRIDTGWDILEIDLGVSRAGPATLARIASRVVVEASGAQVDPERSPDGARIAFTSNEGDGTGRSTGQVYVLERDGRRRRVTDQPAGATEPTWSPNGRKLAYVSQGGSLHTVDVDGTRERTLVRSGTARPDWSPDGRRIVFQRGSENASEIWTVRVATGKLRRLTFSGPTPEVCDSPPGRPDPATWAKLPVCRYGSRDPAWSPDGNWIAFLRHEDKPGGNLEFEDTDLWLMRADGSDMRRAVTGEDEPYELPGLSSPDGHYQGAPSWSPDGRWVVLTGGHCECLLFVDVATGTPRQLGFAGLGRMGKDLDWGPDGTILGTWADPDSRVWAVD